MEVTMAWTEITRRHYRRDALRYKRSYRCGMDVDRALSAGSLEVRAAEKDEPAIGGRGDLVYGLDRLPMARGNTRL